MSLIVQMSLSIPNPYRNLSSVRVLTCPDQIQFLSKFPQLSIRTISRRRITTIRMGGGPRTFPGGVSKWQWKRMQAKKAKQLLKARLCRERQIYEMRKRAELREAVSELERPWEVVERAPTLFSVKADEQLKVLADRFQRPGGYDLWSENDGPQLFQTADGFPSARFFPKGVVHSIKPYENVRNEGDSDTSEDFKEFSLRDSTVKRNNGSRRSRKFSNRRGRGESDSEGEDGVVHSIKPYESVRSAKDYNTPKDFREFSLSDSTVKRSNGSRSLRKFSNRRGRGESDNGREDGDAELTSRKDNQDGKRSYAKKFGFLSRRAEGVEDMKEFGSVDGRKNSRDFNGGRGGKDSSRGYLIRKGRRGSLGSGSGISNGLNSEKVGRNEIPFRGRDGSRSSDRQYNTGKRSSRPRRTGEIYDMSLKQDGTYEF